MGWSGEGIATIVGRSAVLLFLAPHRARDRARDAQPAPARAGARGDDGRDLREGPRGPLPHRQQRGGAAHRPPGCGDRRAHERRAAARGRRGHRRARPRGARPPGVGQLRDRRPLRRAPPRAVGHQEPVSRRRRQVDRVARYRARHHRPAPAGGGEHALLRPLGRHARHRRLRRADPPRQRRVDPARGLAGRRAPRGFDPRLRAGPGARRDVRGDPRRARRRGLGADDPLARQGRLAALDRVEPAHGPRRPHRLRLRPRRHAGAARRARARRQREPLPHAGRRPARHRRLPPRRESADRVRRGPVAARRHDRSGPAHRAAPRRAPAPARVARAARRRWPGRSAAWTSSPPSPAAMLCGCARAPCTATKSGRSRARC